MAGKCARAAQLRRPRGAEDGGAGDEENNPIESLAQRVERYEASLICDALRSTEGDVRETIAKLAVPRKTFYDKVTRHAIDLDSFRK